MFKSRLTYIGACLTAMLSLTRCVSPGGADPGTGGTTGSTAGTNGAAGTSSSGSAGTNGAAGTTSSGSAGTSASGSAGTGAGGTSPAGSAGTNGAAGTSATGSAGRGGTVGTAGTTGSGSAGRGGATGTAGTNGGAGTTGAAGTGVKMDQGGIPLAKVGDMTNVSKKYLNLGDMRLINNRWGSDELGCAGTTQRVFINNDADKSIGWEFNRPACGGAKAKPDYPEVEFGVAPFGANSSLLTSPAFSSTTLLPIQIKNITSASVQVDGLQISLQSPTIWNIDFEIWISMRNPLTDSNPDEFAEIIAFWGWENGRWACDKSGSMQGGTSMYNMCHQSDSWADGKWRFYQFNVGGGPLLSYNGKVDVKAFIDFIKNSYGGSITTEMWLTRIEVGSEIDDNTRGSVKIKNLTFEVNGQTRSKELAP